MLVGLRLVGDLVDPFPALFAEAEDFRNGLQLFLLERSLDRFFFRFPDTTHRRFVIAQDAGERGMRVLRLFHPDGAFRPVADVLSRDPLGRFSDFYMLGALKIFGLDQLVHPVDSKGIKAGKRLFLSKTWQRRLGSLGFCRFGFCGRCFFGLGLRCFGFFGFRFCCFCFYGDSDTYLQRERGRSLWLFILRISVFFCGEGSGTRRAGIGMLYFTFGMGTRFLKKHFDLETASYLRWARLCS